MRGFVRLGGTGHRSGGVPGAIAPQVSISGWARLRPPGQVERGLERLAWLGCGRQDRMLDDVLAETLGQIDRLELVAGKICQVRKIPLSQTAKRITHGSLGWTGLVFFDSRSTVAWLRAISIGPPQAESEHWLRH